MIRLTLFFLVLSLAAVSDIRKRMIPDWMPLLIAGVSLLPPEPVYLTGLLVALPLLIAGITVGGIGGGDIKLAGACGLVFGFERTLAGLLMALSLLLLFHVVRQCIRKIRKLNCVAEKEQAYPLAPFLLVGMVISVFMFFIFSSTTVCPSSPIILNSNSLFESDSYGCRSRFPRFPISSHGKFGSSGVSVPRQKPLQRVA